MLSVVKRVVVMISIVVGRNIVCGRKRVDGRRKEEGKKNGTVKERTEYKDSWVRWVQLGPHQWVDNFVGSLVISRQHLFRRITYRRPFQPML